MTAISLTIYTEPVAKGRARTVINNGRSHSFTPGRTVAAENAIRCEIVQHYKEPPFPVKVPLVLTVIFYCAKPASKAKKVIYPACKPDLDNYTKTLCDAMKGYLVHDDSQIVMIQAMKQYGSPPRIELTLEEVAEQEGLPVISYPWHLILTQDDNGELHPVRRWW